MRGLETEGCQTICSRLLVVKQTGGVHIGTQAYGLGNFIYGLLGQNGRDALINRFLQAVISTGHIGCPPEFHGAA